MSPDTRTSFLLYYIRSLSERTRAEKTGDKYGFDWVIYNLAIARSWTPVRLPFLRTGPTELSTTKTENEFGIDFSFLSPDKEELQIFVLKDEVLNSSNWTGQSFDTDLRKAAAPNLTAAELQAVKKVKVILAYNKDEDAAGIQLFNNLIASFGPTLGGTIDLTFDRWNLTELVERVKGSLLTPSLLPQKFFSLFAYVCAQFADFHHGSEEWDNILIRTWRHFLDEVLKDHTNERSLRLLPVALLILREHGKNNPTFETGWIDLSEWAMLAAWRASDQTTDKQVKAAAFQMWTGFYIQELERFYQKHEKELNTEHFLDDLISASYLQAVAAAMTAFWHLGRLGILCVAYQELIPHGTDEEKQVRHQLTNTVANRIVGLLNSNPACIRPILDLHHIEIFLIWRSLWQHRRTNDIYHWLLALERGLFIRRSGHNPLPFIEGYSNIKRVWETLLTKKKPYDFCDQSSFLVLMLLELCCSLPETEGNELLGLIYRDIVLAVDSEGKHMKDTKPLDLMGWVPPEQWTTKLLNGSIAQEGESLTFLFNDQEENFSPDQIRKCLRDFVNETKAKRPVVFSNEIPVSVIILACIKHRSPLPIGLWRKSVFREEKAADNA